MSVNKEIVKTCLIEDRVKKNWSSIVLAGCVFHYFVSTRFDSFRVAKNFITAERFKYMFFSRNVKHELRVTSSNPRVGSQNSRVASSNPPVTSSNLCVRRLT